jgi:hypothetical protein
MFHQVVVVLGVFILIGIFLLLVYLRANMRLHETAIWLQMQQQYNDPKMVQALHTVQSLGNAPSMNGHGPSTPPMLLNGQLEAVQTVNRYFANVGTLVRERVLNEQQVMALMGPAMSDAWYASRSYRDVLREKHVANHDDFDWLYTEWVNDEYRRRRPWQPEE